MKRQTGNLAGIAAVAALAACIALPALAAEMMAEDTIPTDAGPLVVHPLHHASMVLDWNGVTIFVDPAPPFGAEGDGTAEYTAMAAPDIILVTHPHPDHFSLPILQAITGDAALVVPQAVADEMPADLAARATILANGQTLDVAGVGIEAVPAYNFTEDRLNYHPKGRDNGYVLTLGGKRIYIAGDTEDTPEMRALTGIDAAFVPMLLPYTMDVDHAAAAVKAFKPTVVYPYHYADSDVDAFTAMVGDASEVRRLKWY